MSLKTKVPFFIGSLIITVLLLLTTIYSVVLYTRFLNIENTLTSENVTRADEAIKRELQYLETKSSDWSVWDDTYSFITTKSPTYIDTNMNQAALSAINVNTMAFFTKQGDMFYSFWTDKDTPQGTAPASFAITMKKLKDQLICTTEAEHHSGVLTFPEGILFFATKPVLKSNGDGPVNGTILLGSWLDQTRRDSIQKVVNLPFTIYQNSPETTKLMSNLLPAIRKDGKAITRDGFKLISGYGVVNDITNTPAFYFRVDMSRRIMNEGLESILGLILIEVVVCGVFLVVSVHTINKMILDRLGFLTTNVISIGENNESNRTLPEDAMGDEISTLTRSINQMLHSLAVSHKATEESKFTIDKKQDEILKLNSYMIGREVKMIDLKKQVEDLERQLAEIKSPEKKETNHE